MTNHATVDHFSWSKPACCWTATPHIMSASDQSSPAKVASDYIRSLPVEPSVIDSPLQVYRGWLPAQKVLPHPLPNEDASDARLFQDAHLHFLRVPAHPPRPGPHSVPWGGQLPHAASTTDSPQFRSDHSPICSEIPYILLLKNFQIFCGFSLNLKLYGVLLVFFFSWFLSHLMLLWCQKKGLISQ